MEFFSHGWGMGFGWFIPLLIVILAIYFIQRKRESSSAQEILDRRFANGKIDEKEYKERSKLLKEKS